MARSLAKLTDYEPIEDHPSYFLLRDRKSGSRFMVAKPGIDPETHDAIARHFAEGGVACKPRSYARGGLVRGYSGESGDPTDQVVQPDSAAVDPSTGAPLDGSETADPWWGRQRDAAHNLLLAEEAQHRAEAERGGEALSWLFPVGSGNPYTPTPPPAPAAVQGVPPGIAAPPPEQNPAGSADFLQGGGGATAQPTSAPGMRLPGAPSEITAGAGLEMKGIQEGQDARQQQAAAEERAYAARQAQLEATRQEFDSRMADHTNRVAQLQSDILNGRIEPSRFWNSRSTGQKITAALGMILGGAGAGVTGQPNYAFQAIEKAIDRDIDSQKVDLGRKETLLGSYMQQGRDLQSAHLLAKADAMDVTAAQLAKAAASAGSKKAASDADMLRGQVLQQTAAMRAQAETHALQNFGMRQQMQLGQLRLKVLGAMQGGASVGGGGTALPPQAIMALDPHEQERIVPLGDGSYAMAYSKEDAADVKKAHAAIGSIRSKLQRFGYLAQNGSPVLSATDRGEAQSLRAGILSEMGHLHDLNRLSDRDLQLFEAQVPDLTDFVKPGATGRLQALASDLADKSWAVDQTRLMLPQKRREMPSRAPYRGRGRE